MTARKPLDVEELERDLAALNSSNGLVYYKQDMILQLIRELQEARAAADGTLAARVIAERDAANAALAACRREALEEAAGACDDTANALWEAPESAYGGATACAERIRALKDKP